MERRARLHYLDWARGVATLAMIQGHTFHSWTRPADHGRDLYQISQMIGGVPAVLFLFLTGISLVILLQKAEGKQQPPWQVILRRSGYILGVAFLFRFQQWLFWWPQASTAGLWKVDILNTLAVGLALAGATTLLVPAPRRMAAAAIGAAMVAVATPLVWSIPNGWGPETLLAYLRGGVSTSNFPAFPWISYTFTGVLVGLAIVGQRDPARVDRVMQWLVLIALILIAAARFFDSLPYTYYRPYNYWVTSPNLVANRTAVALLVLAASYGWTRLVDVSRYSWIRHVGVTSLLLYWVHIELVYGRTLHFLQGQLDLRQTAVATAVLMVLMWGLAVARTKAGAAGVRVAAWYNERYAWGAGETVDSASLRYRSGRERPAA